jgi:hypothetical protein
MYKTLTHGKAVCLADGGLHEDIGRPQGHRVGPAASYQQEKNMPGSPKSIVSVDPILGEK